MNPYKVLRIPLYYYYYYSLYNYYILLLNIEYSLHKNLQSTNN